VEAATGDDVTHRDDDDLLAPEAHAKTDSVLSNAPGLDLVFLAAEGFASRCTGQGCATLPDNARTYGSPVYVTHKT